MYSIPCYGEFPFLRMLLLIGESSELGGCKLCKTLKPPGNAYHFSIGQPAACLPASQREMASSESGLGCRVAWLVPLLAGRLTVTIVTLIGISSHAAVTPLIDLSPLVQAMA